MKSHIASNSLIYVQGERRIGKSSLILESIRKSPKYKSLYIDLLGVKSEEDICRRIVTGIFSFEASESFVFKMMKAFAQLRPLLSVDPQTNQPSIGISSSAKIPPETIDDEAIQAIFDFSYNVPGDIQRLCYAVWEVSSYGENISLQHIPKALNNILSIDSRMYDVIINALSRQQLICLKALGKTGGQSNIGREFVEATGIGLEVSVRKALNRLVEKRLVMKLGSQYKICDPFFGNWVKLRLI